MVKPIKLACYIGSNNVDKHNSLIGSMAWSNDRYVLNNTKMHKHTIIMIKESSHNLFVESEMTVWVCTLKVFMLLSNPSSIHEDDIEYGWPNLSSSISVASVWAS